MSTPTVTPGSSAPPAPGGPSASPESWRDLPIAYWALLAALVLNIFSGRWGDMGIPLGPDRLLFAGGLLLLLLDQRIPRPRARLLHGALILFAAWTLASFVLTSDISTRSIYAALDRVLMPFLLFATAPMFLRSPLQRLIFLRAFTLLGLYLAVTAVMETLGIHDLLFPRYIAAHESAPAAIASGDAARAGGPFLSGEANGMALALCAILACLLLRVDHRRGWRALGMLVAPLAVVASVLSLTRSVWLGVALALLLVIAFRRALWQWVPFMAVAGLLLAIGAVVAMPGLVEDITERGTTSRSLHDRQNSNLAAVRAIAENPLTGVGWARFVDVGPDWVRQADTYPVTTVNIEVHNVVLSRAAEMGLPAAILFVGILLAGPFAAVVRRRGDPLEDDWRVAGLAASIVWFVPAMTSPIPYPFPTFAFFVLTGLLWAWPTADRALETPRSPEPAPLEA